MPPIRSISPWIARHADLVTPAAAVLDLACGAGRHGRHFLALGHEVCFLDRDVSKLGDLAGEPRAELIQADLETGGPWPLANRQFGAVIVVNYLHRPLFGDLIGAVGPDGLLFYDTFARGNEAYGKPKNPDHLLKPGELPALIGERLEILAFEEGYSDDPRPAVKQRICARRN
jgi:SAM-dependent methyltransferase